MIQRIQSLYLLLAAALSGSLFFAEIAILRTPYEIYLLNGMGYFLAEGTASSFAEPNLGLSTILFFMLAAGIASIFLYKNRRKQITLTTLLLVLSIVNIILIFSSGSMLPAGISADGVVIEYTWRIILALGIPVLFFLALLGIRRDDDLIKSADRLR